jgi:hypothetical protein
MKTTSLVEFQAVLRDPFTSTIFRPEIGSIDRNLTSTAEIQKAEGPYVISKQILAPFSIPASRRVPVCAFTSDGTRPPASECVHGTRIGIRSDSTSKYGDSIRRSVRLRSIETLPDHSFR